MERSAFYPSLKDLMPHLYDYAALETHPLSAAIDLPEGYQNSRGEYVQRLIMEAIQGLQPKGIKLPHTAVEMRPYLILHKRYVEGINLHDLSASLCLSERQVRRDHNRALEALAGRLWDRFFGRLPENSIEQSMGGSAGGFAPRDRAYEIHPEELDLNELVLGAAKVMQKRLLDEDVELELDLPDEPPQTINDRIILRQILFSLFKYALHLLSGKSICIVLEKEGAIQFGFHVDANWKFWREEEYEDLLDSVHYWSKKLHVTVQEDYPAPGQEGPARIRLNLLRSRQPTVLVVDDQQPALRMYQRYLSRSGFKVVGVADPAQVVPLAHQIKPVLITLDVMMPKLDGWEILQALQLDEATRQIPVIICSAWEEPELAKSLGAAGFLKKPITQKDLLGMIDRVVQ